jgi:hypothetical protein
VLQFISTLQLVGGIAMGMQQRHDNIIKTIRPKRSEAVPQVIRPTGRFQLSAIGIQTARNFDHLARQKRALRLGQSEEISAMLITNAQQIS